MTYVEFFAALAQSTHSTKDSVLAETLRSLYYNDSLLAAATQTQTNVNVSLLVGIAVLGIVTLASLGLALYCAHRVGKLQKQLAAVESGSGFTRQTVSAPQS